MSAPGFFRKAALEKLSTPEKLDQLIKITSLNAWLVLVLVFIAISGALVWGFNGKVKTKINAMGVLLGGEVYDVVSTSRGQLITLNVKNGDVLEAGDIIAQVEQPELSLQIQEARAALADRLNELDQIDVFGHADSRIQEELTIKQRQNIDLEIKSLEKNLEFLNQEIIVDKNLLEKGLITKPQIISKERQIDQIENNIQQLNANLVQLSSQKLNNDFNLKNRKSVIRQRINQAQLRINQLEEQYEKNTNIKSPHSGEVIELLASSGIMVGPGSPLFKIKSTDTTEDKLKGVLYVPAQDGKKISVGMQALVVPSTVKPQEHGYIKATVKHVSEFPVTQQGMMASMQNEQLVRSMLQLGAPFEVIVEFDKNIESPSGFAWTSAEGPDISINTGTSCMGKITVREESPIAMIVPAFKKFFDLY